MRELLLRPMTYILPAMPLHELTHAAAGRLAGADTRIGFDEVGAYAEFRWPRSATVCEVRLAHLAPTLLGLLLGALTGTLAFFVLEPVQTMAIVTADLLRLVGAFWLAVNWFVYAYPDPTDRDPFSQ